MKVCTRCKKEKDVGEFINKFGNECTQCEKCRRHRRIWGQTEKGLKAAERFGKERRAKLVKAWMEKNRERQNSNKRNYRKNAADHYIRELISGGKKFKKVHEQFIEVYKQLLLIKRELRNEKRKHAA